MRLLAIGTMLILALGAGAQQSAGTASSPAAVQHPGVPTAEGQLKFLTDQLTLTSDQQEKLKPILVDLHEATVKLIEDHTLSPDERMNHLREWRWKTDKNMRVLLTDTQKKKLDQLYQEPHPELHGDLNSPASLSQP